jgi:hypothetical protein
VSAIGQRGPLMATLGVLSAVGGLVLIGIGIITRQERAVAAGRRRFHGHAFERRWIPDQQERAHHAEIVAQRLEIDRETGQLDLAAAAARLGVTVATVRRRVRSGKLEGVYQGERLVGVFMPSE